MKKILNELIEQKSLSKASAKEVLVNIAEGKHNNSEIAAFLTTYMMRSIKVEELEGFREALLDLCVKVDLEGIESIDLCGTGGDGKNTFNLSTLSSFVVAASGIKVAKHGNYGVSSASGSSNVMEYFGYQFTNNQEVLKKQLDTCGITFFHAPLFHPAMKNVAPIRKELGMKTFFNMLGPLVNPAQPTMQVTGVYSLELMRLYNYLLQKTNKKYLILHALDGYDEVSLTGDVKWVSPKEEKIISPSDFGLPLVKAEEIFGGNSVEEAAAIFKSVIEGNGTNAQNAAVIANSALAIYLAQSISLKEAAEIAKENLLSGKALKVFKKLIV